MNSKDLDPIGPNLNPGLLFFFASLTSKISWFLYALIYVYLLFKLDRDETRKIHRPKNMNLHLIRDIKYRNGFCKMKMYPNPKIILTEPN